MNILRFITGRCAWNGGINLPESTSPHGLSATKELQKHNFEALNGTSLIGDAD